MLKPNVLLFMTDHQRFDTVPPFARAKTPVLDRFARDAFSFTNAWCPSPHCCPSRASLFSGLYPSEHGVWNNVSNGNSLSRGLFDGVRLFSEDMADSGYDLGYAGKWHVSAVENPDVRGFRRMDSLTSGAFPDARLFRAPFVPEWDRYESKRICAEGEARGEGEVVRPGFGAYNLYGVHEKSAVDEDIVDSAISLMETAKGPWGIYCGVHGPHDPYFVPKEYLDLYRPEEVDLPESFCDGMEDKPALYRRIRSFTDQLTPMEHREAMRHYLAYCSYEDALFGRMLAALEAGGQADNTVVLYLSDHGDYLTDHGLWAKGLPCFEGAYHIPLLIRVPGMKGGIIREAATLCDIAPTLLELCGIAHEPGRFSGLSLAPLMRGEAQPERPQEIYTQTNGNEQYGIQRSVISEGWKLVYNGFADDELYDLSADPHQMRNLIATREGFEAHKEKVKQLYGLIWRFARDHKDASVNDYIATATASYGPGIIL